MAMVRRRATGSGYAALARLASNYGIKAYKRYRSGARKAEPRRATAQNTEPLTGQFDYKTDYRKRRLSRRVIRKVKKRRRWNRKVVNTVRNANVGSTHIIRRALCGLTADTNTSNSVCFGMYGLNGTSTDVFNPTADIAEIFKEIDITAFNNSTNPSVALPLHKIYSMHCTMELTARNTGNADAIIEVYFIRGTRRSPPNLNPVSIYADGFTKAQLASDPNTGNSFDAKLTFSTVGTTPFQSPLFCQHYRIYKRQKFRVPQGNEINIVLHDNKPRTYRMDQVFTASTDRSYHGVLIQQQGPPSAAGAETYALPTAVTYSSIRRYRLKMFRDNLPKTAIDVSGT